MAIYCTGDTHSKVIERFSFKHNPELRQLTKNDTMVITGDWGAIWDAMPSKQDKYILDWMNSQKYHFLIVLGNHENYDVIDTMPKSTWKNGEVLQRVDAGQTYDNIHIVRKTSIFDIDGQHILCISGADSHDIDNLLDPCDEQYDSQKRYCNKHDIFYRTIGETGWAEESVDIQEAVKVIEPRENGFFDIIFTHDMPAIGSSIFTVCGHRLAATEGEQYLDVLRKTLNYDSWIHGHMHEDRAYPRELAKNIACIYQGIYKLVD